jgi:hypothetical protein
MHRDPRRAHLLSLFAIGGFCLAALALGAGCGFQWPPPSIPDAVKNEVLHIGPPVALLTFAPGRTGGAVVGELREWPLPHLDGSEGISAHNFTYVAQFKVIAKSDEDGMPSAAEGTRQIYFHEDAVQLSFADTGGYAKGQAVAQDAISMSFGFLENHKIVSVRMTSHQKSAQALVYKGKTINPPKERDTADSFQGEYSADFGGYILRSLNE